MENVDLNFWHDLIKKHGTLVTFNEGEYLCRQGERSTAFGYVLSGKLCYEIEGPDHKNHIINNVAPGMLVGNYPDCMSDGFSPFSIKAISISFVYLMDARILLGLYEQDLSIQNQGRLLIEALLVSLTKCYSYLVSNSI